jgi:cysteine-rich repeat protein
MARWAALAAGLLAAACQFKQPDDVPPDAPPVDAPVDARPDLVIGTVSLGYRTETGVEERYTDLTAVAIAALVPDDAEPSGFRTIVGAGTADGRFAIEGVPPEAPYYLKVGTSYYWTTQHQVALRAEVPARATDSVAMSPTPVTVPAPPVPGGHALYDVELVSLRAGVRLEFPIRRVPPASLEADWARNAYGLYEPNRRILPSTTAQDELWLLQHQRRVAPTGVEERVLIGARRFEDASIVDGQARTFQATVEPIASRLPVDLSFGNLLSYAGGYDERSEVGVTRLGVHAVPARAARWFTQGWNPYGAPLAESTAEPSGGSLVAPSLRGDIADPFPSTWPRALAQRYERRFWYRAPGKSEPVSFEGGLTRVVPLPFSGSLTSQLMAPPSGVTIGGQLGVSGGRISTAGGPVEVRWTASPGARQYSVMVLRLNATGIRLGPTILTTESRLDLPSDVFAGAEFFVFAVTAFAGQNDLAGGELYPTGVPGSSATTASGPFRLAVLCGDGDLDPGETCDAGAIETAACDLDCTPRECGDGVRNVTAGELCDAIVDTAGCDADCTAPVCGDGHLNLELEQCDDGNAVDDGNGCSAACRFNRCGDGIVQAYGEQCDTAGASATCDPDCTVVECGDRVINAAAGETCDDGAPDDGDGCSSTCRDE